MPPRAPGPSRAPKGQLSPEPLRRQDRAGEATLKGPARPGRPTEGEATGGLAWCRGRTTLTRRSLAMTSLTELTCARGCDPDGVRAPRARNRPQPRRRPRRRFSDRHIGPDPDEVARMLAAVGYGSLAELVDAVVPPSIRLREPLDLAPAVGESEVLAELRALAARNTVAVPMIGLGYHGTAVPPVIQRNVLENPAWYTAYTPYQPEISQGRLEALLNFQTDGRGPHRPSRRQRLPARRGHRRRRGDDADAAHVQGSAGCRPRRRRGRPPADPRRPAPPGPSRSGSASSRPTFRP